MLHARSRLGSLTMALVCFVELAFFGQGTALAQIQAEEAEKPQEPAPESAPESATSSTAESAGAETNPAESDASEPALPLPPSESETTTDPKKALKTALAAWAAQQTPPCKLRALAQTDEDYLLACGEAGLWRVRRRESTREFVLLEREQRGGNVVGFAKFDSELLVLVDLRVLQPLDGGTKVVTGSFVPGAQAGRNGSHPGDGKWPIGTVAATKGLRVELDLTPHHQLSVGYRVAFSWNGTTVVGRVVRVDPHRATVLIGMQEVPPPPGTPVEPTPEPSTSQVMAPRDATYHYTLDVGVRLGLSGDGIFGAEAGLQARYGNFVLSAEVRPFAFSTTGIVAAQSFVSMGLTTRWFGVSFGAGSGTVNRHDANPPGSGILLTPAMRFGTVDGFHVRARVNTTFHRQEMHFSGFFLDAQIPVSRAYALLLGGGGGDVGLAEGEAGVRSLVHGNGGAGSWFLKTSGGATVLSQSIPNKQAIAPHLRVVLETRF